MLKDLRKHVKARFPEWSIAFGVTIWGAITLATPGYFNTVPLLNNMQDIMPQFCWGLWATGVGLARLLLLFVNGTWRKSPHLRMIGAGVSALLWAAILGSYFTVGYLVPNIGLVLVLLALDVYSLWFAAEDAKNSDLRTRADRALLKEVKRHAS